MKNPIDMTEDEKLMLIGQLREIIGQLLIILEPPMVSDLVMRSRSDDLRREADRLDQMDAVKRRARELCD